MQKLLLNYDIISLIIAYHHNNRPITYYKLTAADNIEYVLEVV